MPSGDERSIFVYGTLLRGERNHALLGGARCEGRARTAEGYELIDLGSHPGLVPADRGVVTGEVYAVDAEVLEVLDALEDVPDLYRREALRLEDGRSLETYVYASAAAGDAPRIATGDWRRRGGSA